MEEKKKNEGLGCSIVLLIIVAIIGLPIIFNSINQTKEREEAEQHESQLIAEGKVKTVEEVANEMLDIFQNRKEDELKKYLSKDFVYIDNNNYESKYIYNFWDDLKYYVGKSYLEKRVNSIKDEETYWIYWDIPEQLTYEQYSRYSLQRIFIYFRRTVEENEITYKAYKIILRDN